MATYVWMEVKREASSERLSAAQKSQFGFVFQRFNLFPHLLPRDNVAIGPEKIRGMSRAEARALAEEELLSVHLQDHIDKRPALISP
ncbi:hypothetical protein [Roseobacter sp.]|uniref:hypothetical protein n=1 Tax=Roseobacter sp. TaxID=1907202 RepID=UPI003298ABF3